jgi:hypothetical protein
MHGILDGGLGRPLIEESPSIFYGKQDVTGVTLYYRKLVYFFNCFWIRTQPKLQTSPDAQLPEFPGWVIFAKRREAPKQV